MHIRSSFDIDHDNQRVFFYIGNILLKGFFWGLFTTNNSIWNDNRLIPLFHEKINSYI